MTFTLSSFELVSPAFSMALSMESSVSSRSWVHKGGAVSSRLNFMIFFLISLKNSLSNIVSLTMGLSPTNVLKSLHITCSALSFKLSSTSLNMVLFSIISGLIPLTPEGTHKKVTMLLSDCSSLSFLLSSPRASISTSIPLSRISYLQAMKYINVFSISTW